MLTLTVGIVLLGQAAPTLPARDAAPTEWEHFYEAAGREDLALRYRDAWTKRDSTKRFGLAVLAVGGGAAVTFGLLYLLSNSIDHTPPPFSGLCFSEDGNCPQWQYSGPSATTTFSSVVAVGGLVTAALGALVLLSATGTDPQPVDEATRRKLERGESVSTSGVPAPSLSVSPLVLAHGGGLGLSLRF